MNQESTYFTAIKLYKFYLVEDAVRRHDNNIKMAADELGVTLNTIYKGLGGKKKWAARASSPTQEQKRA